MKQKLIGTKIMRCLCIEDLEVSVLKLVAENSDFMMALHRKADTIIEPKNNRGSDKKNFENTAVGKVVTFKRKNSD